jgi:hypothetical protein
MASYKLKVEKRNKLYFNKFRYKAIARVQGAAYTYYTPNLDIFVERMEKLRSNNNRYGVRVMNEDWQEYWDEVNLDQISQFITWRNIISKDKCMHRIQGDHVSFFSNDLALLQTLDSLDSDVRLFEVKCYNSDFMYFKRQPKYKFRTYFKARRMPKDFSENILTLRDMYSSLHFSKAIFNSLFHNNWHPYRYMHGSYFVEYDDKHMLTILAMWFPDILSKTYSLAKEP